MESINALYKIQLDSASKTTQLNEEVAENSVKLNHQMQWNGLIAFKKEN